MIVHWLHFDSLENMSGSHTLETSLRKFTRNWDLRIIQWTSMRLPREPSCGNACWSRTLIALDGLLDTDKYRALFSEHAWNRSVTWNSAVVCCALNIANVSSLIGSQLVMIDWVVRAWIMIIIWYSLCCICVWRSDHPLFDRKYCFACA